MKMITTASCILLAGFMSGSAQSQENSFGGGDQNERSVLITRSQQERDFAQSLFIKIGKNGEREIPRYFALNLYSNSVLQILSKPGLKQLWENDFALDPQKETSLTQILLSFLDSYDDLEEVRTQKACSIYYGGYSNPEKFFDQSYLTLQEDINNADGLYVLTMQLIRSEVSEQIADFILKGVNHNIDNASISIPDHRKYNLYHGITEETFFEGICT